MRFAPVIQPGEALPAEILAEAHSLGHRSGDMMIRCTELAGEMTRAAPADRLQQIVGLIADEARALTDATVRIGESLAALQARAGA